MHQAVHPIRFILVFGDVSPMHLCPLDALEIPSLDSPDHVYLLSLIDVPLELLDVDLLPAVGALRDVLQAIHHVQVQLATLDLLVTTMGS